MWTDINPDRPIDELLSEIRDEALNKQAPFSLGPLAVPVATLFVRLSRDAERTAGTIRNLTWAIFFLTFVLVVLTCALIWLTVR